MWEVFTCGKMPYGRLKNTEVVERVQRGIVLERPKACFKEVYEVNSCYRCVCVSLYNWKLTYTFSCLCICMESLLSSLPHSLCMISLETYAVIKYSYGGLLWNTVF
jgi:Protein tyrosine kinase.